MKKSISILIGAGLLVVIMLQPAASQLNFDSYQELDCQIFIEEALTNDQVFKSELHNYLKATYNTLATQALKEWTLRADGGLYYQEALPGSALEPESVKGFTYEVAVQKLFMASGTRFKLSHGNTLSDLNFAPLDPTMASMFGQAFNFSDQASQPVVSVTLVQPLLKNAFGLIDRFPVKAAKLQEQAAQLDVNEVWEKRVSELLKTYLNWAASYEAVLTLQNIVADLERLEKQVAQKVKAGVAEDSDLLRTRDNVLNYKSQLDETEGVYLNLMKEVLYLKSGTWVPKEKLQASKPRLDAMNEFGPLSMETPMDHSLNGLRVISKLNLVKAQLALKQEVKENALLPQVDLIGHYQQKGQSNDRNGGFDVLEQKDYSVMLQASFPIGNSLAQSELKTTQASLSQLDATYKKLKQDLHLALEQLAETIVRLEKIYVTRQMQVKNGEDKLRIDKRNYQIGRLDTYYLINSEIAMANARLQKVRTDIQRKQMKVSYLALADQLLDRYPRLVEQLNK